MTGPRAHGRYEELVLGHALSALEPADEQELMKHLTACAACERELTLHRGTLAQLAYAGEDVDPPPALWAAIRSEVVATSGAQAFADPPDARPAGVADLQAARVRRDSSRLRRAAPWLSAAAAAVLVVGVGAGWKIDHDQQGERSRDLLAALGAVQTAPARTVPLADADGRTQAVAVVQADRVSVIVDGLPPNDTQSSVYVLWGVSGTDDPRALTTFDVTDDGVQVVRDQPLPGAGALPPELFVVTKEAGRTAPAGPEQPAVASGRAA